MRALSELSKKLDGPVHYQDVAEHLKVSKWTAYDMMRELAKDNLVKSTYVQSSAGTRGRSQVLFELTSRGLEVLRGTRQCAAEEWDTIKSHILARVANAVEHGSGGETLLQKETLPRSALGFCATCLSALVLEFRARGLDMTALNEVMHAVQEDSSMLLVLVGMLASGLLVRGVLKRIQGYDTMLTRLSKEIATMEDSSKRTLADFLWHVVQKADPGGDFAYPTA